MRDWLTVKEVAEKLGITENTVREKIATKEIKANKVGREWRILEQEVNKVLGISEEGDMYKKDLYIKDLEKENAILKNQINAFKSILGSLNNIMCI